MEMPKLHRAIAATIAAAITLGLFSAVTSIAAADQARLAAAHDGNVLLAAAKAPEAIQR